MFFHTLVALFFPLYSSMFPLSIPVQPPSTSASGVCTERVFVGSRITRTLQSTNDTAVADFNGDGRLDFANQANTGQTLSVQFGMGNGYFGDPVVIDAFSSGFALVSADFNNDGHIDLLTSNKIYIGTGTGSFLAPRLLLLSVNASQFAVGDFNGDDNIDFAGQVSSSRNVAVFFGDGIGSFSAPVLVDFLTGNINSFTVADMNGDGASDLVAALTGNHIGVSLGSPSGSFTPATSVAVGGSGQADRVSAGDVDGDGDLDVVTTTQNTATFITTLLNNGTGTLTAQSQFSETSASLVRTLLVDINFDNKVDYLATNTSGVLVRRFGNGDGTFQESRRIPGIPSQIRMYWEDFTGDGIQDLAVNSAGAPGGLSFAVMVNDGAGNIGPEQQPIMDDERPMGIAHADFNEDGKIDVVVANQAFSFWVGFGDGNGGFVDPLVIPAALVPRAVLVGDVNNDGHQDIFAIVQNDAEPNASTWVAMGGGDGTFGAPVLSPVNFSDFRNGRMPALADLNNDGILDAAMPSVGNSRVALLHGFGNGTFQQLITLPTPAETKSVVAADFDLDGRVDLAVLSESVSVYRNNGFSSFSFQRLGIFPAANTTSHIASADFNGDSIPDLVTSTDSIGALNGNPGKVAILLGSGKGGFGAPREYIVGRGAGQMATGDFNGDGSQDLAVANSGYNLGSTGGETRVSLLYGDGNGLFPNIRDFSAANFPRGIAAFDIDSDGDIDIVMPDWGQSRLTLLENVCLSDPPALPQVNIAANTSLTEGDTSIQLTVTLSSASTVPVSVDYRTAPFMGLPGLFDGESLGSDEISSTVGGRDYVSTSGRLTFAPGETSKNIQFTAISDEIDEFDEYVSVLLANSINASIGERAALITIFDDDSAPTLSIGDVSAPEGSSGDSAFSVPFTLSTMSEKPISFRVVTGGGSATPADDYRVPAAMFTIPERLSVGAIPITIVGDRIFEPSENFNIRISESANASIIDGDGSLTIENDDVPGTLQFSQAQYSVAESSPSVNVTVVRANGNAGGISVTVRSEAGTALPGTDYTEIERTIQFAPDETSKVVQIPILRDDLDEQDETVNLILENAVGASIGGQSITVLTITDIDDPPSLVITDAEIAEGDSGQSSATVFATLSRPSQRTVSVSYTTADASASAPSDYMPSSGTLEFAPGVTRRPLIVMVNGDVVPELNETFTVNLSVPDGLTLADTQSLITIFNDDQLPAGSLSFVSANWKGTGSGNHHSARPSISDDGRFVAFESTSVNLVNIGDDGAGLFDVFVRDIELGTTRLVSINSAGNGAGNCHSSRPRISGNGRFVAFSSCAGNLVGANSPGQTSVFIRDLETNQTHPVSVSASATLVSGEISSISDDGRFVVFQSSVQGVTAETDSNAGADVFIRDTVANVTHLVSVNAAGTGTGNGSSGNAGTLERDVAISPNGRYILFPSFATDLSGLPRMGQKTLFVRDLNAQTTVPVAVNTAGTQIHDADDSATISDDGRYVFFASGSDALVSGDTNGRKDVFRRDTLLGSTILVSVTPNGSTSGNHYSDWISGSGNGRYAVFSSLATNLSGVTDTNDSIDVFWRDLDNGETRLASINVTGSAAGHGRSYKPSMSTDGRFVLLISIANDLVAVPDNAFSDVYIRDMNRSVTYLASGPANGTEPSDQGTLDGVLSGDGSTAAFESIAGNLLPNDTNGTGSDVFAFRLARDGSTPFDFDGDGKADQAVFRPESGEWFIYGSGTGFSTAVWGNETDKLVAADYDGDGKTDHAIFRDGTWWILKSTGGFMGPEWGTGTDTPVPADYDGDGRADLAIYREGTWWIYQSTAGAVTAEWGNPTDIPVPADYDGDGKADIAIFRDGTFWILKSTGGFMGAEWGTGTDKPVPADYDGDGTADLAIYREGTWWIYQSTAGAVSVAWGNPSDIPIPADYDGDGKTDVAIFRDGDWWIYKSSGGFMGAPWGLATDIPIPRR